MRKKKFGIFRIVIKLEQWPLVSGNLEMDRLYAFAGG